MLGPTLVRMTWVPGWFVLMQRLLEKMVPPPPPLKCPSSGMPLVALDMAAIVMLAELPGLVLSPISQFISTIDTKNTCFSWESPLGKSPQPRPGIDLNPVFARKPL